MTFKKKKMGIPPIPTELKMMLRGVVRKEGMVAKQKAIKREEALPLPPRRVAMKWNRPTKRKIPKKVKMRKTIR